MIEHEKTMKLTRTFVFAALAFVSSIPVSHAEEDWLSWLLSVNRQKEVAPVKDSVHNEECSACHFPYQPGLLPERSWRKLLAANALEDHFGENAELDEETRKHILDFLVANAADKSKYKRSLKIMASLKKDETPLRITEVSYIRRKHHDIPAKLIKGNPKVKSLSFCDNCHNKAGDASFDDDTVNIPGYGNWTW